MACQSAPDACRRDHIAARLDDAEPDSGDYEARCPVCGHGGFRISRPTRSNRLRNVWTCNCQRCRGRCPVGDLRTALLRRGISAACLGIYDGDKGKEIPGETARAMDQAINDILNCPGLKLQDVRIVLAEAQGRKIPTEYTEFVKFAKSIGLAHQQAYEAARRWASRPSDCPPVPGEEVVDTSRSTDQGIAVKSRRSRAQSPTEKVETAYRKSRGAGDMPDTRPTEKVDQTPGGEPDTGEVVKNLGKARPRRRRAA